ncbi:MAG: zinc ribbon domain-containing protein [Desulfobacterales bacterium]|nr:zinc ribbon domain-containing protein [Desulfobacterales bacterium]
MPIYEYHCNNCDENFELLIFGKEQPICPSCKNKKVVRLMSACGFMSKGSGGETVRSSAADSSCGGCAATSCSTCGH